VEILKFDKQSFSNGRRQEMGGGSLGGPFCLIPFQTVFG
jgi:hypothetical protein